MEVDTKELAAELAALDGEAFAADAIAAPIAAPPAAEMPEEDGPLAGEQDWAELLGMAFPIGFAALAPNWEITPTECEVLAGAYAKLAAKYIPEVKSDYGPEIMALGATVAIFAGRIGTPRVRREKPVKDPGPDAKPMQQESEEVAPGEPETVAGEAQVSADLGGLDG